MSRRVRPTASRRTHRLGMLALVLLLGVAACGVEPPPPTPSPAPPVAVATLAPSPSSVPPATLTPAARPPATSFSSATAAASAVVPATAAPRQTPTPRGAQTLTLVGGVEAPRTFDPALVRDAATSFLARQVFSGLLRLDERLEPAADLAVAMPSISGDRLTYRFTLRPDVVFHDGTPVTAERVRESLERATDPALAGGNGSVMPGLTYLGDIKGAAARLRGTRAPLDGVRVTGPSSLEIELVAPQAAFLTKLTHTTAAVVDVRQATANQWWKKPNGTGPFRLTEWRDGDRLVLTRHDGYYAGRPSLERVIWLLGANVSQPLNLYEGDKVDLVEIGTDTIDRALVPGSRLNKELRQVPQLSLTYLAFNVREPPFDDPKVRQALTRVIDREKMARVMFEGKVQPAAGLVPPSLAGGSRTLAPADRAAETAAARHLLADSRYGANLPRPRLYVSGGGLARFLREIYQRELGLTVDVIGVTWNDFLEGLDRREYSSYVLSWLADYPDPQTFVDTLFRGSSPENHTGYANAELDAVLDAAARTDDQTRRGDLYLQAQQRILDDAVVLPLYFATDYVLVKPRVKGLTVTPLGILSLHGVWIEQ